MAHKRGLGVRRRARSGRCTSVFAGSLMLVDVRLSDCGPFAAALTRLTGVVGRRRAVRAAATPRTASRGASTRWAPLRVSSRVYFGITTWGTGLR